MQVTLENEKDNVVKLDITVPAKDAADAYNQAVRRIYFTFCFCKLLGLNG